MIIILILLMIGVLSAVIILQNTQSIKKIEKTYIDFCDKKISRKEAIKTILKHKKRIAGDKDAIERAREYLLLVTNNK